MVTGISSDIIPTITADEQVNQTIGKIGVDNKIIGEKCGIKNDDDNPKMQNEKYPINSEPLNTDSNTQSGSLKDVVPESPNPINISENSPNSYAQPEKFLEIPWSEVH